MQIVPLQAVPSQQISVNLGGQACMIQVAQKTTGMFMNLFVNDALIIGGVICENLNVIVRSIYLGFVGDLAFVDTMPGPLGPSDPVYTGLGTRFVLAYFAPSELPAGVV